MKLLNTYIVESDTNYGLMVHVINAEDDTMAKKLAIKDGAWDDCVIHLIDTDCAGIVLELM